MTITPNGGEKPPYMPTILDAQRKEAFTTLLQNDFACPPDFLPEDYQRSVLIQANYGHFFKNGRRTERVPGPFWHEQKPLRRAIRCAEQIAIRPFFIDQQGQPQVVSEASAPLYLGFALNAINGRRWLLCIDISWEDTLPWLTTVCKHRLPGTRISLFNEIEIPLEP